MLTVSILIVIFGSGIVQLSTGMSQIVLDTNLPGKINQGSTVYATLSFTVSSDGSPIDPAELTVTVTDPLNRVHSPAVERIAEGEYAFSYTFSTLGVYYIRIIASSAGYVSASHTFSVDCVKQATYWDIVKGFVNSPVVYALWLIIMLPLTFILGRKGDEEV